jgi:hypothetical protein
VLDLSGTAHGVYGARKFRQHPVASVFDDAATVFLDFRFDQLSKMRPEASMSAFFIHAHKTRVARHISSEDGGQPAFDASRGQSGAPQPHGPNSLSALEAHSNGKSEGGHSLSVGAAYPGFGLIDEADPHWPLVGYLPRRAFQADALASLCQCLRLVIAGDIRAAIENLGVSLCNAAVKIQELRIEIAAHELGVAPKQAATDQIDIARGNPVKMLFGEGYALQTVLLSVIFFCSLLNLFLFAYWLPEVLHLTGMTPPEAARASSFRELGAILGCFISAC